MDKTDCKVRLAYTEEEHLPSREAPPVWTGPTRVKAAPSPARKKYFEELNEEHGRTKKKQKKN